MPRSIQDILDHADELAARFENYEPDDERPVEEYLLQRAALARARSERQIVDAITAARAKNAHGHVSASSSAPPPKQHNSATATSSPPTDIGRVAEPRGAVRGRFGTPRRLANIERLPFKVFVASLVMASELKLVSHEDPDPTLVREIVVNLVAANNEVAPPENHRPLAVDVRLDGQLVGGTAGYTHWGWLFVSHLWVDDAHRGHAIGSQLMTAIEQAAKARGAESAHVDTFDFQAFEFYKKIGYRIFGQLEDYPTGHTRFFLQKQI